MGSRSKVIDAYIAGFLDGDGSLMLQLKKRKDGRMDHRFMATICFYQDTRHDGPLAWIRRVFGIGYLSKRNDGMSELRINGYKQVKRVLELLLPYIRFKRKQARALIEACEILSSAKPSKLGSQKLKRLVDLILAIQNENYIARRKKTKEELYTTLGLTP